jgi:hypothetical protein
MQSMEAALSLAHAGALETRHVLRDGTPFAILKTLEHGNGFTVVAELVGNGSSGASQLRPYTFARREDASAFLTEVASSFAYLGCEVQRA